MGTLRERARQLKEKRPGYGEILDFYSKVRELQDRSKSSLKTDPIKLEKERKDLLAREGFSLIRKEDFPLDIEASIRLFRSLCRIGKAANPHMAGQVEKIDEEDGVHNLWSIAARFAFLSVQAKAIGNYLLADNCEREFRDKVVPQLKATNSFYWLKSFGRAPLFQPNPFESSTAGDEFTFLFGMFHQLFNDYVQHRAPAQFSHQPAVLIPPAN